MGTIRSCRRYLSLLLAAALIATVIPFAVPSVALANYPYDDYAWPTSWLDIVWGGVWNRQALDANRGLYAPYGFDRNFVWYCSEGTIWVQPGDSRAWTSNGRIYVYGYNRSTGPDSQGNYWTTLNWIFYSGAPVRVWHYGNAFIGKACGNNSWGASPPPPRISGYKWNDLNQNGVWESGEPALNGWKINFYRSGVYMGQATTNSNGYYEFMIDANAGRLPGSWTMTEEVKPGWVQTRAPGAVWVSEGVPNHNYANNNFGNFELGKISGTKWVDLDGNGSRELPGDESRGQWTITLKRNGAPYGTMQTGSDGSYLFKNLPVGTYTVEEQLQTGWTQTFPSSGSYTVPVTSGTKATGKDFGNAQLGSITPVKIHDANANGVQDVDEPRLSGWTMRASGPVPMDPIVTDLSVLHKWSNLPSGAYRVWEDPSEHPDYEPTGPTEQTVDLGAGQNVEIPFLNVLTGDIHGAKYHDLNGNHARDDGEPGIEGWTVTLTLPNGDTTTTATDGDGTYRFGHLLPGDYRVTEEQRSPYWVPMTAVDEAVTLAAGQSVDVTFGNLQVGDLAGVKYHDLNGDGAIDPDEPTVAGVAVALSLPDGTSVGSPTNTDANGRYKFTGLKPGTYLVTETVPDGWAATVPTSRMVTVAGGRVNPAEPFLNVKYAGIGGAKFDDSNANGVWDSAEETGVAGWEIGLDKLVGGTWSHVASATTGDGGAYYFDDLLPGEYRVVEATRQHWRQTYAPSGTIALRGGDEPDGFDFGNVELASFGLFKWDDSNSNGLWDNGERGLPWTFKVTGTAVNGEPFARDVTTGDDGMAQVIDVLPGQYRAEEQTIGLAVNTDGTVAEAGWRNTTPTSATLSLDEGSSETTSFGNIHLGWVWGRVTHEVYKTPVSGIRIELEETGESTYTNADGYYFFYREEPNETSACPTPDYTVGMDIAGTQWRTTGAVDKSVVVPEGGPGRADFGVYENTVGNQPRTIGYWKNWNNHYTRAEMQALVDTINLASGEFSGLTVDQVYTILQLDKKTSMEAKARTQFLAFWLNVASGNLGFDTGVRVSSVEGWQTVVDSADSTGQTNVIGLLFDMEEAFAKEWAARTWETIKNILDAINNGLLT